MRACAHPPSSPYAFTCPHAPATASVFCSRTLGIDVGHAQAYMYSCRSAMHIVRTEHSMRGWIVYGSPGVLLCSTGRCLSLSCLTTVRRCPNIFSNASCFALGTDLRGIRSIVILFAMALLALSPPSGAEIEAQLRPPEKCNPRQRWKTALMIALLRWEKRG